MKMLPSVVMVLLICFYASLCLWCSAAAVTKPKNSSLPAVIAFGDSFADSGNNNFRLTLVKANFFPYGKDFMGGIPTGRFSNGKTLADAFAAKLGVKDYLPAYLDPSLKNDDLITGVSFASGGSGYDPLTGRLLNVYSITDQLEMFKDYIVKLKRIVGEEEANEIIEKSLYLVSWSSNDWAISYTALPVRAVQYNVPAYAAFLVEKGTEFIQEMYKLGARKMAFFNTPILGCFPLARTIAGGVIRKCGDIFIKEAQTTNTMLNPQIQLLGRSLPQSRFIIIDYFKILQEIVDNYLQYGFEVVNRGCCGTGILEVAVLCNQLSPLCHDVSKYLYWDSLHLTERGYNIVVDHALQDMMNILV